MDQHTNPNPDQADDDILTYTVSDEVLEAEAGMERVDPTHSFTLGGFGGGCC